MRNRKEAIISICLSDKGMEKLLADGCWLSNSKRNYEAISRALFTAKTHGHDLTVHFVSSKKQIYVAGNDQSITTQNTEDLPHIVRIDLPPKGTRMVFENNLPADVLQGGEHIDDKEEEL